MDRLLPVLKLHPNCRVCDKPSETVRQRYNPPWGLDAQFNPQKTVDEFLDALETGEPFQVVGVCEAHLDFAETPDGEFIDTRKRPKSKSGGNWVARRREEHTEARSLLIAALGGKCRHCKTAADPEEMRVRVPERTRHELGISTRAEWYRFLLARPALLQQAQLYCLSCDLPTTSVDPDQRDARGRVIQAYGGHCALCPRTTGLMVAARPGTPPLRWPNGDKYNSPAKVRHLINAGFPSGWAVVCPAHLAELTRGSMYNT